MTDPRDMTDDDLAQQLRSYPWMPLGARLLLDELARRLREARSTEKHLRSLIARAYHAYYKEDWEEGECFNEIGADLRWEGIDCDAARRAEEEPDAEA